jgi:putative phosphoesterase
MVELRKSELKIGVISDTHGLFRNEIPAYFNNVDYIIHAGDIGTPEVIEKLSAIAPVCAVLGNTDPPFIFTEYNYDEIVITPDHKISIVHILNDTDLDFKTAGFTVVISGHTHRPLITTENGILYINPGSAGPQRSNLPISAALLYINNKTLRAELLEFDYA